MYGKAPAIVFLTVVVVAGLMAGSLAVTWAAPSPAHRNLPPPPTSEKPPTPEPKPTDGGGGGGGGGESKFGGSRFPHCNSTVEGFVTNYSAMAPGSGVLVEVGGGGWRNQVLADDNGYFAFKGLCPGTGYVRVIVPPGSLLTNPDAEVALDGKNHVRVDQGFFLPVLQAVSGDSSVRLTPSPAASPAPVLQRAPAAVALPPGVAVSLSAPRTVRVGMDARLNVSVQNGGPGQATGVVVRVPLATGIRLQEADTSRGGLKIEQVPQALGQARGGRVSGLAAPRGATASELVIDIGTLPPGEVVLITTKFRFKETVPPGSQAQFQALVWNGGVVYRSNVAVVTLEEAGSPFQFTLPTTGEGGYLRRCQEWLW